MIFVTVGTHEQPFNRLLEAVDRLKGSKAISDEVLIQSGFSTYAPKYCTAREMIPYAEILDLVSTARIVISHGGPASFLLPLQYGKIPVVVPRLSSYGEHVNDHQVDFVKAVEKRYGNIIPVYDVKELGNILANYDEVVASKKSEFQSNNKTFNEKLERIVKDMI